MNGVNSHVRNTLRLLCVVLVAVLVVPFAPATVTAQSGAAEMPYRLSAGMTSSTGAEIGSLSSSGKIMVWEDHRGGDPDVYYYDMADSRESRVSRTDGIRREPAIHGSTIVWVEGDESGQRTIRGVDLAEGNEFALTEEPGSVRRPVISSDLIAWQQRSDDRWVIRVQSRNGDETETFGLDAFNAGRPDISGHRVVWQEHDGTSWNIRAYDAETGETSSITSSADDDQYPAISENHVVFLRSPEDGGAPQLISLDLETGEEDVVVSEHFVQRPSISGRIVVWEDWRSGLPDVYAYDLVEGTSFAVARSQQANAPVVSESVIAWVSGNDPARQRVRALEIRDRLPTDPQEPPAVPTPDSLYIQETQHYVSSGFKSFWQANGGPQILGFPLTMEFTEQHPETGEEIIVQYFERIKLEFHPGAGEEDRIRMSLLGHERRPDRQADPVEPFESDEEHRYFPETGQAISYGFKEFWEKNGGLELFGFPITGEFTENGRTVQYFERARFELDPESETGDVTLGLLGREALQERGWLPPPPRDTTQIFD